MKYFVLILCLTHYISTVELSFYEEFFSSKTPMKNPKLVLNNKTFLELDSSTQPDEVLFQISNDYLLSGCQFYPYKHVIMPLLTDYFQNLTEPIPHFQIYVHSFSLVYQLLYLNQYDNLDETFIASDLLRNENISPSEYFTFEPSPTQKEYLFEILRNQTHLYNESEIKLIKRLNLTDKSYEIAKSVFEYVNNRISTSSKISEDRKNTILSFTNDMQNFFTFYYYITKNSFPLRMSDYLEMNKKIFKPSEINKYQTLLENQKTPIKNCFLLSPLLSMIKLVVNNDFWQNDNLYSYSLKPVNGLLNVTSHNKISKGVLVKAITIPNQNAYFDYGYNDTTSFQTVQVLISFHKDLMGNGKRRSICFMTDCEGFGIDRDYYKGYFILNSKELNPQILNIARLINLDESTIDLEINTKLFERRQIVGLKNEIDAYLTYYKLINQDIDKFDGILKEIRLENTTLWTRKEKDLGLVAVRNYDVYLNHLDFAVIEANKLLRKEIFGK